MFISEVSRIVSESLSVYTLQLLSLGLLNYLLVTCRKKRTKKPDKGGIQAKLGKPQLRFLFKSGQQPSGGGSGQKSDVAPKSGVKEVGKDEAKDKKEEKKSEILSPEKKDEEKKEGKKDEKKEDEKKEEDKKEEKKKAELKPKQIKRNEKEERIAQGKEVRNKGDYPTFNDVESDWDSDKEKKKKEKEEKEKEKEKEAKPEEKKEGDKIDLAETKPTQTASPETEPQKK
ncbi:hypothetical protein GCK32_013217 [Trichostrongylus colubriformis]|uniref:Uncharacterized protein n=1 Tax=Trichostrongylus colubriformis TaxID=6319 RepID=A0AAN8F4N9_TRICO